MLCVDLVHGVQQDLPLCLQANKHAQPSTLQWGGPAANSYMGYSSCSCCCPWSSQLLLKKVTRQYVQPTFCSAVSSFLLLVLLLLLLMVAGLAVAVAGASSALPSVRPRRDRLFALTTATPDRGRCVCSAPSWTLLDSFESSMVNVARQATRRTRTTRKLATKLQTRTCRRKDHRKFGISIRSELQIGVNGPMSIPGSIVVK
jgi:hypothetical protein